MNPRISGVAITSAVWALLAVDLILWAVLGQRIAGDPGNHVSFDTRGLIYFSIAQLVFSVMVLPRLRGKLSIALLIASGASVVGSTLLVTENILLPYDLWLERGMPMRPF